MKTDLLNDLASLLQQEKDFFGESTLTTTGPRKTAPTRTSTPQAAQPTAPAPEEPMLFGEPEPPPLTHEPWGTAATLPELDGAINTCTRCVLGNTRNRFVFGVGNPHATLLLIGEAPGADEDAQGEPFVGRAGQLLNKILEAIHFKREEVYICNILKCRPPGNRKPAQEEVNECLPFLKKQISLVQPKLILCLGLTAAESLLGTTESLTKLRGRVLKFMGVPLMVTYHPAALLRNPNWKRPTWEDVQAARKLHDELVAGTSDKVHHG